ncbi:MAG: selenide, water dikinase SelD [Bacteroidales bacterium]|nr:selenide, water dikinase SelD [Bacteroidales bacterium]
MKQPIYLDYNATTPVHPEVTEAIRPYLESYFGNPSSAHLYGAAARTAVEKARAQVASLLGCYNHEIIFTSGGSESNNMAIKGIARQYRSKGNHIITSSIEHPAVYEVCKYLENNGFRITWLPVDDTGMVLLDALEKAIATDTILITIMHANNEVGTIQPVREIATIAHAHNILFHTDAAQSAGKIPVNDTGADLISLAGHKLYAPKGVGALYIKEGVQVEKLIHGADHEHNLRAGTENVALIVGLGNACELAARDLEENAAHAQKMRDLLYQEIQADIPEIRLNGHPEKRLPNTLSVSFPGIDANLILSEISSEVAASAGAACHTGGADISPTLTAMHIPFEAARGTIRFSTGKYTTEEEILRAAEILSDTVHKLQTKERNQNSELETQNSELKTQNSKLTQFTAGLGCACKLRPQALEEILQAFPTTFHPDILVGLNESDDAAVYRINDEQAIVQTLDFFTPIVDDPYTFGAIAAANALSDIYAMGAKPLFALNIVGFPTNRLPIEVLKQILQGAVDKAAEAGIQIIGGHTVEDPEPKFGMAVTGIIHPDKILKNNGNQPGDVLVLTKPIGTGILTTAMKRGLLEPWNSGTLEPWNKTLVTMLALNKEAAEVMQSFPVSACTDITGFGLLGHLKEMLVASNMDAEVYAKNVPLLPGTEDMAAANVIPGGTLNNFEFISPYIVWAENIPEFRKLILCDAQTSGGLLVSLPESHAGEFVKRLAGQGITGAIIGKVISQGEGLITVI